MFPRFSPKVQLISVLREFLTGFHDASRSNTHAFIKGHADISEELVVYSRATDYQRQDEKSADEPFDQYEVILGGIRSDVSVQHLAGAAFRSIVIQAPSSPIANLRLLPSTNCSSKNNSRQQHGRPWIGPSSGHRPACPAVPVSWRRGASRSWEVFTPQIDFRSKLELDICKQPLHARHIVRETILQQ
jgi:hypothetical protein